MAAKGQTLFRFNDFSPSAIRTAIVNVGLNADLVAQAVLYNGDPLVRYATPILLELVPYEIHDDLFINEQWYLQATEDNLPQYGSPNSDIEWDDAVPELVQAGNQNIRIGIIDSGIPMDEQGNLTHPDINRCAGSWNFNTNGTNVRDLLFHGTATASLLMAAAHNDGPNGEDNWGMEGMDHNSLFYAVNAYEPVVGGYATQAVCDGLFWLAAKKQVIVISLSLGTRPPHNLDATWEEGFAALEDDARFPLLVMAAGNYGGDQDPDNAAVGFPARYAFWGDGDHGHSRGYSNIISVGASNWTADLAYYSSHTFNKYQIGVLAPSAYQLNFTYVQNPIAAKPDYLNLAGQIDQYFRRFNGTSAAAPLVAGLASLILTKDEAVHNGTRTLSTWQLRRILEKTAARREWSGVHAFDENEGYGIINSPNAIQNRDYNYWEFQENTWYFISANLDLVHTDVRTVMEDLALDTLFTNDTSYQLTLMEGWSHVNQALTYYDKPYLHHNHQGINTINNWDSQSAYKLKIKDLPGTPKDSLLIIGKRKAVNSAIQLYDDAQSAGWNWVAYYPDYTTAAHNALPSIATRGDPNSDLCLAKGPDGSFYFVDNGYDMLTMRPGEGYEMQLNGNRNVQLVYPVNDPDQAPRKEDEPSQPSGNETEHFVYHGRTGDFLPVLITGVDLDGRSPDEGDEIGLFICDTLCIGASFWQEGETGIAAWYDDATTEWLDGFKDWHDLTFRYYDKSEDEEIGQIDVRTDADMGASESIMITDLYFNSPRPKPNDEPQDFGIAAIYPNPTNSAFKIIFALADDANYDLSLFDASGRLVSHLLGGRDREGLYSLEADAMTLPSGTYLLVLRAGKQQSTKSFAIVR